MVAGIPQYRQWAKHPVGPAEQVEQAAEAVVMMNQIGRRAKQRERLLTEVWGYSAEVMSRTVDTHVAELRRKLERDPGNPRHILTVRKTGYRLAR